MCLPTTSPDNGGLTPSDSPVIGGEQPSRRRRIGIVQAYIELTLNKVILYKGEGDANEKRHPSFLQMDDAVSLYSFISG